MNMIMHSFVFVPAVVFCTVTVVCWGLCQVLDRLDRRPGWPPVAALNTAPPARGGFRPVVIEGGAISSFRVRQTPLGSGGAVAKIGMARSYGG